MSNLDGGKIIRVLFGDLPSYPKLWSEVTRSLQHEWCRKDILHVVAGQDNYDILTVNGAEHVIRQDLTQTFENEQLGSWYLKPFLIRRAMDIYNEILFLDFDTRCIRVPDEEMWYRLRAKGGRFHGEFQAPNVGYRRPVCLELHRNRKLHSIRRCLNTSLVYCSNVKWIDQWLTAFVDVRQCGVMQRDLWDETILMHMLDKTFGVMDSIEMVEHFEPTIMRLRRAIPEAQSTYINENVYFTHR